MDDHLYGALIGVDRLNYRPVFCPCSFGRWMVCPLKTKEWHSPWKL